MRVWLEPSTSPSLIRQLGQESTRDAAWQEFVRRYGRMLFQWGRQWGLQPSDAEDVAQDTLLSILKVIQDFRYDPAGSFRGWMRTIAQHAWSRARESRKWPAGVAGVGFERLATLEARDDLLQRFEAMARQELFERAVALVQSRVEPSTWQAFAWTSLEHRDCDEVARTLGMTTGNVYVARSRVRTMLRQAIEALDREP